MDNLKNEAFQNKKAAERLVHLEHNVIYYKREAIQANKVNEQYREIIECKSKEIDKRQVELKDQKRTIDLYEEERKNLLNSFKINLGATRAGQSTNFPGSPMDVRVSTSWLCVAILIQVI